MTTSQPQLTILPTTQQHRPVLEQLWTMFRHDMSAYSGALPDTRGRFRQERLDSALADPAWAGYLLLLGSSPAGLAVVRGLDSDECVMTSLFVVNGARRKGHGSSAVRAVTAKHPGQWAVAFQDANTAAARFWSAVAAQADRHWSITHRDVPDRSDLPPDAWISFTVR